MDWVSRKQAALLALEQGRPGRKRTEAAVALRDLAAAEESHWPELVPVIAPLVADGQSQVRRVGLSLAGLMLSAEEAEPLFVAHLSDASSEVRLEATGQLADQARLENRRYLASMVEDADSLVRFEAARGLALLHHPSGLEVLTAALKEDALRFRALGALAELGDARAIPALRTVLKRWLLPGFERTQAAGALAKLGEAEGLAYLFARTRRRRGGDRGLAIELLGELKATHALERLLEILVDPKDFCRGAAARSLGRLGDARALAPLLAVLKERGTKDELRLDVAEGLCLLGAPGAREEAKGVLSDLKSADAREELLEMLREVAS